MLSDMYHTNRYYVVWHVSYQSLLRCLTGIIPIVITLSDMYHTNRYYVVWQVSYQSLLRCLTCIIPIVITLSDMYHTNRYYVVWHVSYQSLLRCLTCIIPIVIPFLTCWFGLEITLLTWSRNRAHECRLWLADRGYSVKKYSSKK
jgi:predicted membrane protein